MPNWCNNGLVLTHKDPAMIERVIAGQKSLLQEFIPCPQELIDTVSGFVGEGQDLLEAKQRANVEKYGYTTWYEHNVNEWGTKWDVHADTCDRVDENTVHLSFDSAWSPPIGAYQKLEAMGFGVQAFYNEGGMCYSIMRAACATAASTRTVLMTVLNTALQSLTQCGKS